MHKLKALLRAACALGALPLAWTLSGCSFNPRGPIYSANPADGGLRCDVVESRRCATAGDLMVGIDVSRPFEDGFWLGRSSKIGIDKSPAAVGQCGEGGQAIIFRCPFPDGCRVCVNCSTIGSPASHYPDPHHACVDYCLSEGWGNATQCTERAVASHGSPPSCFPAACTADGCNLPNWADPRRLTPTPTPPVATPTPTPTPTGPGLLVNGSASDITVTAGSVVTVGVFGGPGLPGDWVARYVPGTPYETYFPDWRYLDGTQVLPTVGQTSATLTFTLTTPGIFHFRFLQNNGPTLLATSAVVTVAAGLAPTPTPSF